MKKDLICWDTSVLINWLQGSGTENRMLSIKSVMAEIEAKKYKLAVSILVYVEVLECKMKMEYEMLEQAIKGFEDFMKNRNLVEVFAVDIRIAKRAQALRNRMLNEKKKKIGTPDAIHIATAIVSNAKQLHTFDKEILKLNGKDEVEGLIITECDLPGANWLLPMN